MLINVPVVFIRLLAPRTSGLSRDTFDPTDKFSSTGTLLWVFGLSAILSLLTCTCNASVKWSCVCVQIFFNWHNESNLNKSSRILAKTRSDESNPVERGYPTASPWPALSLPAPDLDPVAAAWGRKFYPSTGGPRVAGPGLMFGLHHHQDAAGLHHHHQPRGPSLKEEPLTTTRSWMQPTVPDQNG